MPRLWDDPSTPAGAHPPFPAITSQASQVRFAARRERRAKRLGRWSFRDYPLINLAVACVLGAGLLALVLTSRGERPRVPATPTSAPVQIESSAVDRVRERADPPNVARIISDALRDIATRMTATITENQFEQIEQALGRKGAVSSGMLQIALPPPQPSGAGGRSVVSFRPTENGTVAASGEVALGIGEVEPFARALLSNGALITALYNNPAQDSKDLYVIHFWMHDRADRVIATVKLALDAMRRDI